MNSKMYQNLFSAVICMCLYHIMGEKTMMFRARKNTKVLEDYVNKTVATDSLMMCVTMCKLEQSFLCQTVSWGDEICLLSDTITIHEFVEMLAVNSTKNWITMSRIDYQVFLAEGTAGRYSLTFKEAESRCLQSVSRIASRNDLLDARNIGFELCNCGWLSDNTNGFVMQKEYTSCWYTWHTGILECGYEKSDVYCKSVVL